MTTPVTVDLPHRLGKEEAKRRMRDGIGGLTEHLPAGAQADSSWSGDRMDLSVTALGQKIDAALDVEDNLVRVTLQLPAALSFFAKPIETMLRKKGGKLLEDRSDRTSG